MRQNYTVTYDVHCKVRLNVLATSLKDAENEAELFREDLTDDEFLEACTICSNEIVEVEPYDRD